MDDVDAFAQVLLVVCAGLLLAIGIRIVSGRLSIPSAREAAHDHVVRVHALW